MIQGNINGGNSKKIQESSKNHTARVGYDFYEEIEKMNKEREDLNKKSISMNVLTNLLIKHNSWDIMYKDLIKFDLKNKNGK